MAHFEILSVVPNDPHVRDPSRREKRIQFLALGHLKSIGQAQYPLIIECRPAELLGTQLAMDKSCRHGEWKTVLRRVTSPWPARAQTRRFAKRGHMDRLDPIGWNRVPR